MKIRSFDGDVPPKLDEVLSYGRIISIQRLAF
jgi:hypothetical protein